MTFGIAPVGSSQETAFDEAYRALAAEFEVRGELERRTVIEGWLDEPPAEGDRPEGRFVRRYQMLVARDRRGALAGVRDFHVVLDRDTGIVVVYLAHVLVLPAFRRSGLGALFRQAPLAIAARLVAETGTTPTEMLFAAEMEAPVIDDPSSVVRLVAYGKGGFAAIATTALPYQQPDFRLLGPSSVAQPIPLLAVVRHVGHEGAATLPKRLARAFVRHLYAVFATHVPAAHLATLERATLDVLDRTGGDDVPLLPLPRATDDLEALASLRRGAAS